MVNDSESYSSAVLRPVIEEPVDLWRHLDPRSSGGTHYSVLALKSPRDGMAALRAMFPDGRADSLNQVLFSTSGVHGHYCTVEDVETTVRKGDAANPTLDVADVTFLIVHPRMVCLRYGNCTPATQDDIDFLKRLRESSHRELAQIGIGITGRGTAHEQALGEIKQS